MVDWMGRTVLSPQRLSEIKRTNIGRIIIFCEGKTEKYYFDYFAEIIRKNKYTDIEVILQTASGNARAVLNCANKFMTEETHIQKYGTYGKYLAFDCDAPPNAKKLEERYEAEGKNIFADIENMNPFTNVYKLTEQFMAEISRP